MRFMILLILRTFCLSFCCIILSLEMKAGVIDDLLRNTLDSQRKEALIEAKKGNYNKALALIDEALRKSRDNPVVICEKIVILYMADRYSEALEASRKFPPKYKTPDYIGIITAKCLCKTGKYRDAVLKFEELLQKNPKNTEIAELLLNACIDGGYIERALRLYGRMTKQIPEAPWLKNAKIKIMHAKAVKLGREGKFAEADKILEEAFRKNSSDMSLLFDRIVILSWAGKYQEAVKLFDKIPEGTDIPEYVLTNTAKSFEMLGNFEKSEILSRKVLAKNPENENALRILIKSLICMRKYKDALDMMKTEDLRKEFNPLLTETIRGEREAVASNDTEKVPDAKTENPKTSEIETQSLILSEKFEEALKSLKTEELKKEFTPLIAEAMRKKAVTLAREGKFENADNLFARAYELDKKNIKILYDRITALSWAGKDKEALKLFESLPPASKIPDYVFPEMAKSYRRNSEYDKALQAYSDILNKDNSRADAALGVASLLAASGNFDKAESFIDERIKKYPEETKSLRKIFAETLKETAVKKAREGKTKEALALIERALKENSGDLSIMNDYITILSWSGMYKEAIEAYKSLPEDYNCPVYVQDAVGNSLRKTGAPGKAAELYRKILEKEPENKIALLGFLVSTIQDGKIQEAIQFVEKRKRLMGADEAGVRVILGNAYFEMEKFDEAKAEYDRALQIEPGNAGALTGMSKIMIRKKNWKEAEKLADMALLKEPENIEALYCKAEALEGLDKFLQSYQYYDKITKLPGGNKAVDEKYRILSGIGAPGLALEKIKQSNDKVSRALMEKILGDEAAARISRIESKDAENLLERNISMASSEPSESFMSRSRYDKFIVTRQMKEMKKIIADYDALMKEKANPPYWVIQAAADAKLYFRKPKEALKLYQEVEKKKAELGLGEYPENFVLKMSIYYTLIELERFEDAGKILDELQKVVKPYRIQRGVDVKNWDYNVLLTEKAWWLIFQDKLSEAEDYLKDLLRKEPFNTNVRTAQAYLHYYRDWPRLALEDFQIAASTDPEDKSAKIGLSYAMDKNDDGEKARDMAKDLLKHNPNDLDVQKLNRKFEIDDMRTETINFAYSQQQNQADGFTLSQRLEQPIFPHRKVYVETVWMHVLKGGLQDDEIPNSKEVFRNAVGFDWRLCRDLTIMGAGSIDYQGKHPGGQAGISYTPDDHWTVNLNYNSYSLNAPAWIYLDDGYGQEYYAEVKYRYSEDFKAEIKFDQLFLSDHNIMTTLSAKQDKLLSSSANWKFHVALEEALSFNSKTDTVYYSPGYNATVYLVPYVEHLWYRNYEFSITDRLYVAPGVEFEKGQSAEFAGYVKYEQEWTITDTISFLAGVTGNRTNYDGDKSYGFSVFSSFIFHF